MLGKKLIIVSLVIVGLALVFFSRGEAIARTYSTSFPDSEDPISEGGNWTNANPPLTEVVTTPGHAHGTESGTINYTDSIATLQTGTWGPNQSVQATVYVGNTYTDDYPEVELYVRFTIAESYVSGYNVAFSASPCTAQSYLQFTTANGDDPSNPFTILNTYYGPQYCVRNGDVVKMTISGNVIRAYKNGTLMGTVTDSNDTFTGGYPGMGFNFGQCAGICEGTNSGFGYRNFIATDGLPNEPTGVPGAPRGVTAAAGNALARVNFGLPASNGGSRITGYTATSSPGSITATGVGSPIKVNGLTNGQAYSFTVTATNANGTGPPSKASNIVTPSTVPGAPTIGTATAGNAQATVSFTAPASNGGSAIEGFIVTSSPGARVVRGPASANSITVRGLANGHSYTFTVKAINKNGIGPASSPSNSVIPSTVPGPPRAVSATRGDESASVSFKAPLSDGGSTITGYTATSHPGGLQATGQSPIVVGGLTNGKAYTFSVTATNANGPGPASSLSNTVIPEP